MLKPFQTFALRIRPACFSVLFTTTAVMLMSLPAQGQTVYEGFNPTFPVYGGGIGLSGVWGQGGFNVTASNYAASESSLSYAGFQTSGGSVSGVASFSDINGAIRSLAQSIGTDNTTVYVSFLVQPQGTLDEGLFNGFFGFTLNGSLGNDLFIGKPGAPREYVIETRGGFGQVSSGTPTVVGDTALLVLKAQFLPGSDIFTLYTNPTPGDPEPSSGAVKADLKLGVVSQIGIYSTGAFAIDEIRIGATYADVVPAGASALSVGAHTKTSPASSGR